MAVALERARFAADDPQQFAARLTDGESGAARSLARMRSGRTNRPAMLAATLLDHARRAEGADAARAIATAYFVAGDPERAAVTLETIEEPRASDWNDLAAAQLCAALKTGEEERLAGALAAVDRARALAPHRPETLFNRAAILDAMGAGPAATALWRQYLGVDSESRWSGVVRRRLAGKTPSEREVWKDAARNLDRLGRAELSRLTRQSPEQARRFGEGAFLSAWAEAVARGDDSAANSLLGHARSIAEDLQHMTGEALLVDAVAAIDGASESARESLVAGHLVYRRGRMAYDKRRYGEAERDLRQARDAFAAGGSPMAGLADFYVACAIFDQDRPAEALTELSRLLTAARASAGRYRALLAQIHYEIALCEAVRGHWSASLRAADEAAKIYAALGERGNGAAAAATLSENYDFVGRPERAWSLGVPALRAASAAGDLPRARTILAVLCRTEMRGTRWERALAITTVEVELAPFASDGAFDADLFRRRAVAEWHLGAAAESMRSIATARAAAWRVEDEGLRTKLIADIDGAGGTILRHRDPRAAVGLLTSAITFQKTAVRPILLPELQLERGRAYLALNDLRAAEHDFEEGITELERQRRRTDDLYLRSGIFADASELFDEAVSLQLRLRKGAEAMLAYVERGRARAVLEQIEGLPDGPAVATVAQIQRKLAPGSVLVEYVALPRTLVIIVIAPDRAIVRTVGVERRTLDQAARHFADVLASGGNSDGTLLYDSLIQPIANELEGVRAINIVADYVLERVAFAALRPRTAKTFLVERYAIATAPSAAVFAAARDRLARASSSSPATAVVFGNPDVPRDEFPKLASLDGAEREASIVAAHYRRSEVFVRSAATARSFLDAAPRYEVVHFAGHAVVRPREPATSALILATDGDVHGALTLRQIGRMRFRSTRVVVLAACSTLRGRNEAIEGVPSIARGFLIAGVPAVLGTLWDIEDSEAAPLVRAFHKRVAGGAAPAEALRDAQIGAIRAGRNPSAWAAFALAGVSGMVQAPDPAGLRGLDRDLGVLLDPRDARRNAR